MKHFRKVCAVLLAMVMAAVILPTTGLLSIDTVPSVDAAGAGEVVNGGFDSYESYTGSSGQTAWKAEGWDVRDWGNTLGASGQSGKGVQISKDSSHKDATQLTQVVPVNTNATYTFSFYAKASKTDCAYVACFTYSLDLGTTSGSCTTSVVSKATVDCGGSGWKQFTYTVTTGSNKYLKIRFIGTGVGSGDSYLDTVALTVVNEGDTGTHGKASLTGFATDKNRPNSDANNVIKQPGFESTDGAQWNTPNFLTNGVSIVEDAAQAHSGNKVLKYYRGGVAPTTWSMFEVTLPKAGEYVLSAWVRTPNLSKDNVGKASIGIIDSDTGKFLTYEGAYDGHFSNKEIQLRSTATDNKWHLRSVTFYVGADNSNIKIGMYGLTSEMYVDDISVHLLSNGVTYSGNQKGKLSASDSAEKKYCVADDSLIPDYAMTGNLAKAFWASASGWNLGMMEIAKDPTNGARGNTLHYKGTNTGSNKLYNYIKWIYVEPNTSYTVSFDYRVAAAGNQLMFIDNNIDSPQVFHTPSLGSAGNEWKTYAFTFNTGNYNRIGIVLRNSASAELYLDDFRFFKTSDGVAEEPAEEVFPTLKNNKENPVVKARMEMNELQKLGGLGFKFDLECTGAKREEGGFTAVYDDAYVIPFEDGVEYRLLTAGAVVTNDEAVGTNEDAFVIENINDNKTVIDIEAKKFYENTDHIDLNGVITFAVRVTNIPIETHAGTQIYARPYYVFEYNGQRITVYGEIVHDSYEPEKDVNDGNFSDWEE